MKILQNDGKFEIWNPTRAMEVYNQLEIIELAGRVCWKSESVPEEQHDFIRMLIRKGHHSVLEHSSMTVRFWNVSRGFTYELVRHRLCAFSQRSTRYVNPVKKECDNIIAPPEHDVETKYMSSRMQDVCFREMMEQALCNYKALIREGMPPQDARQVLPIGIETEIVITANFREWRHIFEVRCQKAAHWEIRILMCELLKVCKDEIPVIFEDFEISNYSTKLSGNDVWAVKGDSQ